MKSGWSVLGSGAWGTALALLLAENSHGVCLWCRSPEAAVEIKRMRENKRYLPGVILPECIGITSLLEDALKGAGGVIFAVPSQSLRSVARQASPYVDAERVVISASKGLEVKNLKRMTTVLEEELPGVAVGAISGPNFAQEVAKRVPTASVIASSSPGVSSYAQDSLMTPCFRVYTNRDIIGVEMGGALKNIYAIGVGIIDGMKLGNNTRAAFMTRGLSELVRLGVAMGAEPYTFSGLSGIGDLILTATGNLSRNRRCGIELGKGRGLEDVLVQTRMVVEGVETTRAARAIALGLGIDMPLVGAVYAVLFDGRSPREVLCELMTRGPKNEVEDLPGMRPGIAG